MKYINNLSVGFTTEDHKNKKVVTSINSKQAENHYNNLKFRSFTVGKIPAGYEHRPDLISNLFYGNPSFDWYICYFNNITDIFNELNVGDKILIPSL